MCPPRLGLVVWRVLTADWHATSLLSPLRERDPLARAQELLVRQRQVSRARAAAARSTSRLTLSWQHRELLPLRRPGLLPLPSVGDLSVLVYD